MRQIHFVKKILLIILFFILLGAITSCGSKAIALNNMNAAGQPPNPLPETTETPLQNNNRPDPLPLDLSKIQTVTYCELLDRGSDYDHRVVRLRAIYFNEFERSYLYDSNCKMDSPPFAPDNVPAEMWTQWDTSFVLKGDSAEASLNRQINGFGRKDVTLIGRFYKSKGENDPSETNLFGHRGCCQFQFLIMHVEEVHSVKEQTKVSNKFGARIKFKLNEILKFSDFTLECLEISQLEHTFMIKSNGKEMTISVNNNEPAKFSFNGVIYKFELEGADKTGRIAKDELIISRTSN